MLVVASDYRKLIQIAIPFAVGLLVVSTSRTPTLAEGAHMLVIPASDGYGFDDCLSANKACGRVIADAWCEAHGMSASLSFGRAEDITASIASSKPAKVEPGSFVVNCKG